MITTAISEEIKVHGDGSVERLSIINDKIIHLWRSLD
jgi:hypothetical protein